MALARPPDPRSDGPDHPALAHAGALCSLARHLTGSTADAEDLVQEAFVRAFRGWGQFTPGTNLRAWLLRILRNAWLDRTRHERRSPVDPGSGDQAEAEAPVAGDDAWLRGDVELERMRGVVAREIEEAIQGLGEEQRTAVLLDLEGLSEAEMALVLGCPIGTVKSRLWRARAALRAKLSAYRRR